jgi:hypothetical protein
MDNLKDILSHLSTDIDQETLLLYLQDKLTPEKKHEVEKKLLDNEFANDAAEGLQEFKNKEGLSLLVDQLNRDLKKKLKSRKSRAGKIHLAEQPWIYFAVVVVIILIVISFFIIQRLLKP